jgi:uncharacterized protein
VDRSVKNKVIPVSHIEKLLHGLAESGYQTINLYWHGGEPLLAGLSFYENAVEICTSVQSKYGVKINHKMQSNATLINDKWIDFFLKNNFKVGTSLDGMPEENDHRIKVNGASSHEDAVRGILLMKSRGMDSSMLSVLTRAHLHNLDEHYKFVKEIGVRSFKVNPCIVNKVEEKHLQVQPVEWGKSMCNLFDIWFDDPTPPRNREFESIIRSFFVGRHTLCSHCKTCFKNFLSIVPSGDIYPCAKLINDDPMFFMGNINDGIKSILEKYSRLSRDYDDLGCNECKWKPICNGGCTAYAYFANGNINTRDYLCEGYKILYQHIYDKIEGTLSAGKSQAVYQKIYSQPVI